MAEADRAGGPEDGVAGGRDGQRREGGRERGQEGGGWRVEERVDEVSGETVFDVYRGERRLAWGLKDRTAAERWLARLGGRVAPVGPVAPVARPRTGETAPARAWWMEREEE